MRLSQWQNPHRVVRMQMVNGPSFWQTTEIEEAPRLLDATMAALNETVTA